MLIIKMVKKTLGFLTILNPTYDIGKELRVCFYTILLNACCCVLEWIGNL